MGISRLNFKKLIEWTKEIAFQYGFKSTNWGFYLSIFLFYLRHYPSFILFNFVTNVTISVLHSKLEEIRFILYKWALPEIKIGNFESRSQNSIKINDHLITIVIDCKEQSITNQATLLLKIKHFQVNIKKIQ